MYENERYIYRYVMTASSLSSYQSLLSLYAQSPMINSNLDKQKISFINYKEITKGGRKITENSILYSYAPFPQHCFIILWTVNEKE